jgi:hypothetical protein
VGFDARPSLARSSETAARRKDAHYENTGVRNLSSMKGEALVWMLTATKGDPMALKAV